jgi:hypothetical protein
MPPTLPLLLALPTGIALGALDRHPLVLGAPTEALGFAVALALGAVGCALWFRRMWAALPVREGMRKDASAGDWWSPRMVGWVWAALSALPQSYVPGAGRGPTRQLPACALDLRVVATGWMVMYGTAAGALYCVWLWGGEVARWAVG